MPQSSPPVQPLTTFDELSYPPPAGYALKDDTTERIPSLIPGTEPAVERYRSYVGSAGHRLHLFSFRGLSSRDRGPMKAEESWNLPVDGREARISRVSMFFGAAQNLLTAHFDGPSGAHYLVYTDQLDRARFEAFLATLKFHRDILGGSQP